MATEREWARALARQVAAALPEVVRQLPDLRLTAAQVKALKTAFENHLVQTMGEDEQGERSPARKPR